MAVSRAKKKPAAKPRKQASKASSEKTLEEVKEVAEEPKADPQPESPAPQPESPAPEPEPPAPEPESKPVAKKPAAPKQQKATKALVLKHKIGDTVSFQGKEWRVLVVVDKRQRERLRIECDGVRKAVWLEDLD